MVAALAPGGVAVIFDNEADSRFGRRMALRKLVTRYSGLPLVPRYYCNAAYPPLARIQKQTAESAQMVSETVIRHDAVKRTLVVQSLIYGGPAHVRDTGGQESTRQKNDPTTSVSPTATRVGNTT